MNYEDYTKEELISLINELSGDLYIANREIEDLEYEGCSNDDEIRNLENKVEELEDQIIDLKPQTVLDEMKMEILMELRELHIDELTTIQNFYKNGNIFSVNKTIHGMITEAMDDAFTKQWMEIASQHRSFLPIDPTINRDVVNIELCAWDHTCADGCCTSYGTELIVNGDKCDNEYSGDYVEQALKFTLTKLGYTNVNVTETYNKD